MPLLYCSCFTEFAIFHFKFGSNQTTCENDIVGEFCHYSLQNMHALITIMVKACCARRKSTFLRSHMTL